METIVVTGAAGAVGRRVCAALAADPDVTVIGIDRRPARGRAVADHLVLDLQRADLKPVFEGATTLVHLASSFDPERDDIVAARADVDVTRRVLDAAGAVGVGRLVLLSSAMVYGAWSGNPVPLTEDAPLRPNPEFAFAAYKAEVERLAHEWRRAHPDTVVTMLRPATALAHEEVSWVARTLRAAAVMEVEDSDPPVQFLHLDDLAAAVVLASRQDLPGPYNVAPDGALDGETRRELAGRLPRVRLSAKLARRVMEFFWRHRLAHTPPGLVPYTMYPWVVASDRLHAAGWEPTHTNEEAYVAGTPALPWASMNAKRRQQIAMGAAGVVGAGLFVTGAVLWRRLRR